MRLLSLGAVRGQHEGGRQLGCIGQHVQHKLICKNCNQPTLTEALLLLPDAAGQQGNRRRRRHAVRHADEGGGIIHIFARQAAFVLFGVQRLL